MKTIVLKTLKSLVLSCGFGSPYRIKDNRFYICTTQSLKVNWRVPIFTVGFPLCALSNVPPRHPYSLTYTYFNPNVFLPLYRNVYNITGGCLMTSHLIYQPSVFSYLSIIHKHSSELWTSKGKKGTNTFANISAHAPGLLCFRWTPFNSLKTPSFGGLENATLQTKTQERGLWLKITPKVHLILSSGAEEQ